MKSANKNHMNEKDLKRFWKSMEDPASEDQISKAWKQLFEPPISTKWVALKKRAEDAEKKCLELREQGQVLRLALDHIVDIENKDCGGDWDEIQEARSIARAALSKCSEVE